jgi:DNA repair exonuclease SbcCD ATPase subunit
MTDEKVTFDRICVEDLRDEFHDALVKIADKANKAIESAEEQANEYREKLSERIDDFNELTEENKNLAATLRGLEGIEKQKIDFERVERLIDYAPGDPGHNYPLHDRVEKVLARAMTDRQEAEQLTHVVITKRDKLLDELDALKAAIVPELERLEGHEKRLREIVEKGMGKHLVALLQAAKNAF